MTTLHQRLLDDFHTRIASGDWPEGAPVPSEAELCERTGASRGTVRRALAELRAEGLIAGGRGRPPVVRRSVPSHHASVLGSFTAWARSAGHEPGQHTVEVARRRAGATLAQSLDIDPDDPVVAVVRVRLLDGEPAMLERLHYVHDVGAALFDFDTDSGSINTFLLDSGADLYESVHVLDAVAAEDIDVEHLDVAPGSPILCARRRTFTSTGRVVESSEDRYVPGRTSITVENRLVAARAGLRSA